MFTRKYEDILINTAVDGWTQKTGKEEETRELINRSLKFVLPRFRLPLPHIHKFNIAFAIAEWLSYMTGIDDISYFTTYIKKYKDWSSDGVTLDGAYGPRINVPNNQIQKIITMLEKTPSSRRAVLSIYHGQMDLIGHGGLNTPCTLTLQFLVRGGYLHAITNMRSNDVVWGLPYDLFCFTMIQEFISTRLGLGIGTYYHNAASSHLYKRHFEKINALTKLPKKEDGSDTIKAMLTMPKRTSYGELRHLLEIYKNPYSDVFINKVNGLSSYFQDFAYVARAFVFRNEKIATAEEFVAGKHAFSQIKSEALKMILAPWMESK